MTCSDPLTERELRALSFALKRALSEMMEEYWCGNLEKSYETFQIADYFGGQLCRFCMENNIDRNSLSEIKELLEQSEPVVESLKNDLEYFA